MMRPDWKVVSPWRVDVDALPYAAGAFLLGLVTIAVQDFALQWQPVPQSLPARAILASASGLLLFAGALMAVRKGAGHGALLLPLFYASWVLILHLPNLIANPNLGSLLGLAEILSLAIAGFAMTEWARRSPAHIAVRIAYGSCAVVFGLSHFMYVDITASMVPGWMPAKHFWAYFTGAAHLAAGVAIMSGVLARVAATLLAIMCGSFVLLLHVPRVLAAPGNRLEWTMLAIALSIAGGAWLMRRCFPSTPRLPSENSTHE